MYSICEDDTLPTFIVLLSELVCFLNIKLDLCSSYMFINEG